MNADVARVSLRVEVRLLKASIREKKGRTRHIDNESVNMVEMYTILKLTAHPHRHA